VLPPDGCVVSAATEKDSDKHKKRKKAEIRNPILIGKLIGASIYSGLKIQVRNDVTIAGIDAGGQMFLLMFITAAKRFF